METLPTAPESPRRKRVAVKTQRAIDALLRGEVKNITQAAALVGCSREHLSRELHTPHVQAYFQDKVKRHVTIASGRAAARLTELLDSASDHVSLEASKHALAVAGVKPSNDSVNVQVNVQAGYVIDLTPPNRPPRSGEVIVGGAPAALPRPDKEDEADGE